jgi:hypothetical protein
LAAVEVFAQAVESLNPEVVEAIEPILDVAQLLALQRIEPLAPFSTFSNDTGIEHDAQMLRDRGAGDREIGGEVADSPLAVC